MAKQNKTDFKTTKNTQYADNTTQAITEATHRTVHENVADSAVFLQDEWPLAKKGPAPVRVAMTSNVDLSSEVEDGDTQDGVTLATGDRFLAPAQTDATENGIWVVQDSGAALRATDFNSGSLESMFLGAEIYVQEGTANAKKTYTLTAHTLSFISLGNSELTFEELNSGGGTTINGSTDNGILTYISSSGEIQTESNLIFNGTDLDAGSGTITVDNISSSTTNTDLTLSGNGTGDVVIEDFNISSTIMSLTSGNENMSLFGGNTGSSASIVIGGETNPRLLFRRSSIIVGEVSGTTGNWDFKNNDLDAGSGTISADNISSSTTNTDLTLSGNGTGNVVINDADIGGGEIDGTVIGANSAAAINGTTGGFSGDVEVYGGTTGTRTLDVKGGSGSASGGGLLRIGQHSTNSATASKIQMLEGMSDGDFGTENVFGFEFKYDGDVNELILTGGNQTTLTEVFTANRNTGQMTIAQDATFSGDVDVTGALSKGSGTFKITHPNDSNKWLYHSFVEAPRADNIYRGKAELINGEASVQIDTASNMTIGTFDALNQNIQVFVNNNDTWDKVRASYSNGFINIECENASSTAQIDWLVIGERKDKTVKDWKLTDENGHLIPEWDKE